MAQLAMIVMCRSGRAPPPARGCLTSLATKRATTQKAAYVPGHISGEFAAGAHNVPNAVKTTIFVLFGVSAVEKSGVANRTI